MGKAIYVSPPIKTVLQSGEEAKVKIVEARIVRNQYTSIGQLKLGLGIEVEYKGERYSHLFSIDREVITGSAGRLLVSAGIKDTDDPELDKKIKTLEGKEVRVINRGGKLYWYP